MILNNNVSLVFYSVEYLNVLRCNNILAMIYVFCQDMETLKKNKNNYLISIVFRLRNLKYIKIIFFKNIVYSLFFWVY